MSSSSSYLSNSNKNNNNSSNNSNNNNNNNNISNGNTNYQHSTNSPNGPNGSGGQVSSSNHTSHTSHATTSSAYNPSTNSFRSIVSPPEYPVSSYDPTGPSYKDEPRRDYWADRPRPTYASSTTDSRDIGRYGHSLM